MFTGLIQEIGIIKSIIPGGDSAKIEISSNQVLKDVAIGDSIAVNGTCLTVTEFGNGCFTVDAMPETIKKSNLGFLKSGDKVNLEPALKVGQRLGGHIVSGHIDGVGSIKSITKQNNSFNVLIEAPKQILKYIVQKGSIAIDGISLTVIDVNDIYFSVGIIPHTGSNTFLIDKKIGATVNLECDLIGKYVEKLIPGSKKSNIDDDFLIRAGFLNV